MTPDVALIERQTAVAIDDVDVDFVPHVQGVASSLDDLILNGSKLRAQLGDAVVEGNLERSIEGASTLTIDVKDDAHELLQSPLLQEVFDVELDGLGFRFVKCSPQGKATPLTLTFEDREVARLRGPKGARKAFRGKMTRAEFSRRLVRELKPAIPFYCPMLHQVQPIGTPAQGRANQNGKLARREPGLPRNVHLTIKGETADAGQIRNMDRALDVATSLHSPDRVMLAMLVAGMAESLFQDLGGGDRDSGGVYQQRPSMGWGPTGQGVEVDTRDFLKGRGGNRGALAIHRSQPSLSAPALAQAVQRSGAPGAYQERMSEAVQALNAYKGGSAAGSSTSTPAKDQGKFPFERKKNENTWDCIGRLADEVKWRRFCAAGVVYYIAETDLLASKRRMLITPDTPGLEDFRFDYDRGKPITEVTVSIRARALGLPPGTSAELEGFGPADGRYIASKIAAPLRKRNSLCDVTLTTPTVPLPEPILEANKKSKGGGKLAGKSGDGGLPDQVHRMKQEIDRITALHLPYQWGGGHTTPAPANGRFDCSSFVSRILQVGGFHNATMVSGALARWGAAGAGRYCTIYANSSHTFIALRLTDGDWHFAGTSHENPGGGPGWHSTRSASGFSLRHPPGF